MQTPYKSLDKKALLFSRNQLFSQENGKPILY